MAWIERHWKRITPVSLLLYPASLLFRAAVALRRAAYRAGILSSIRLPVPVIVAGNLTVGGTGKTPLVLWLASFLLERGRRPGIVSRGYGGTESGPSPVPVDGDPRRLGDEPVLLARRSGCPVWIGTDRVAAAQGLLAAHPDCDVVISDDGLQHYRLGRDMEIVVRPAGTPRNGWLLPAGPFREPAARAAEADAVVLHGGAPAAPELGAAFTMQVKGARFYNLLNPELWSGAERFRDKNVEAIAGIGDPDRFFSQLRQLGITFAARPFPDHHLFSAADLAIPGAEIILMTEKDAVKCQPYADERHWVLRVDALVDPGLGDVVLGKLGN
jgi:tetraacyldisaccharide 4'-kinase